MPPKSKIKEDGSDLVKIKFDNDVKRHEMKMEELKFVRETERINHENSMSRMRIKSAEIKRSQERREASYYPRGKY